jgi:methylase of polypeptide subunit release factors
MRATNAFMTIRSEGMLLPPDLLQRVADGDANLGGLTPDAYHRPGERLNEAINGAWNALQSAWANFTAAREKLLPNDPGTSITRERWLLPLFRALDYGRVAPANAVVIDGKTYPISHRWEQIPIHLLGCNIEIDKRTPGIPGAATMIPHSLMQVYLNRDDSAHWGFVSNGLKLRILRDNASLTRQAFVEFDLQAMMDGERYPDFFLMWLLCHQSRVEGLDGNPKDCWLERWSKAAQETGTRALDQLRDGVQAAIEALGVGFIEHPANTVLRDRLQNGEVTNLEVYRQLLRLVYRLIILFTAEDREKLYDPTAPEEARQIYNEHYSTRRLRNMAERIKGSEHSDLWEQLRLVMRLLSGEYNGLAAQLALPKLGSFLFSDRAVPDLIDAKLANVHLLKAVFSLAFRMDKSSRTLRTVDYKHLGAEELGSVYESLLELRPVIDIPARTFVLQSVSGSERKTTGSYYTPSPLISALLDSALDPVIERARRDKEPTKALLNLKICDPACGSGHFLIAAAYRLAKVLASVRTGEEEPAPEAYETALREVIAHCLYGVDLNEWAVELCKVNLWLESLEPGKPLSFLDHRILVGNSLLGATPALMARGIPDDAFNAIEGDSKADATRLKKLNRAERRARETGQLPLFDPPADYRALSFSWAQLDEAPDSNLSEWEQKEAYYAALRQSDDYRRACTVANAWCAAFVWDKRPEVPALTDAVFNRFCADPFDEEFNEIRAEVERLTEQYHFFHWHCEFPDVFRVLDAPDPTAPMGWTSGFDCVLGNPPWERIKIQEKEWFAARIPDIAKAPNAAARRSMIEALLETDAYVYDAFASDLRRADGESHFIRNSGHYPLTGRGDVNTYAMFAETNRMIVSVDGFAGFIIQSDIATSDTNKFFFADLMAARRLVSFHDFVNLEAIFPHIHRTHPHFCLITLAGKIQSNASLFSFWNTNASQLSDTSRQFTLSQGEIELLNPNTRTAAIFRNKRDAEIATAIYRRVPVMMLENEDGDVLDNPWNIRFAAMLHMSNDSGLFRTADEMLRAGFRLKGNHFVKDVQFIRIKRWRKLNLRHHCYNRIPLPGYLPLYEAKMMHQYDHRWATYDGGEVRDFTVDEKRKVSALVMPRYWVDRRNVQERLSSWSSDWLLGWRDITNSTNERTTIAGIAPISGCGDTFLLMFPNEKQRVAGLVAGLNSYVGDFAARQKIGGTHMKYHVFRQLPIIPPHCYTPSLLNFIAPRVLELTYTAWDLKAFAQDMGYHGAAFKWDDDRRFAMRAELDALYFHLYGISRDDADYIMETFPIVKRKDVERFGSYITKEAILDVYDQLAALPKIEVPAPKGGGTMLVPDVSLYVTPLDPPPGDARAAHNVS